MTASDDSRFVILARERFELGVRIWNNGPGRACSGTTLKRIIKDCPSGKVGEGADFGFGNALQMLHHKATCSLI